MAVGEPWTRARVEPDAEVRTERDCEGDEGVQAWIGKAGLDPADEGSIEPGDLGEVGDRGGRVRSKTPDVGPDRATKGANPTLRFALRGTTFR